MEARTGQQIAPSRTARVEAAVRPLMRELGCTTLEAFATRLATDDGRIAEAAVEAMLNNETSWFRDRDSFAQLTSVALPSLAAARVPSERLQIWCAGCSTGQEPYSLAMAIADSGAPWRDRVRVTASDVSATAVERARVGDYSRFEIQRGLPVRAMMRWFVENGDGWRARDDLRHRVRFVRHHLFEPPPGRFDVILCRNVLMYFSPANRTRVFDRLAEALAPDGLLVLGAGETVLGQTERFMPHTLYRGTYMQRERRVAFA